MHDTTAESILCPLPMPPDPNFHRLFFGRKMTGSHTVPPLLRLCCAPCDKYQAKLSQLSDLSADWSDYASVFFFFLFLVFIFSSTYTFPTLSFISKRNLDSCAGGWLFPGGKDWRWIALQWENTAGLFQFGASGWFLSNLTGLEEDPFSNRSILHFLISSIRSNLCIHSEDTVQWFSTRAICKRETASIYIYNQERSEKNYYSHV